MNAKRVSLKLARLESQNRKYRAALRQITKYVWSSIPKHLDVHDGKPVENCHCGGCCMVRTALAVLPKPRKS